MAACPSYRSTSRSTSPRPGACVPSSQNLRNRNAPCKPCVPPPNIQPRKNFPPMVPEFKQVIHQNPQTPLPAQARLLSAHKRGYVASARENNGNQVTVGVHFAPEEFLSRLCHPTEHNCLFPKEVRANVTHLSDRSVSPNSLRAH